MPTAWRGHELLESAHAHAKPWAWHPINPPTSGCLARGPFMSRSPGVIRPASFPCLLNPTAPQQDSDCGRQGEEPGRFRDGGVIHVHVRRIGGNKELALRELGKALEEPEIIERAVGFLRDQPGVRCVPKRASAV